MITSVYLSNDIVRIVQGERSKGSSKVREWIKEELSEGSLLNGIILNDQELFEQLQAIWTRYNLPEKNVELILNSTKIISKNITISKVKENQVRKMLPLEFSETDHQDTVSYDYALWDYKKGTGLQEIMAVMAEDRYLQSFVQLFARMNVEITKISVFRTGIRNFLRTIPEIKEQASIIFIVDGNSLISILWDHQNYAYMDRKRLFVATETDEFALEVVRNINAIMQFHESQKRESAIIRAYTCGFSEEDLNRCREQLEQFELNLTIEGLPHREADMILVAGGLIIDGKDINLLHSKVKKQADTKLTVMMKAIMPVAVVFMIFASVSLVLLGINLFRNRMLEELLAYTNNPENTQKVQEYDRLEAVITEHAAVVTEVETARKNLSSYPLISSSVTNQIIAQADNQVKVLIEEYDALTGALKVKATVSEVTWMNQYIDRLYTTKLFRNIEYSGYTYQEAERNYVVNMICYLDKQAGR